ncbi:hypothetical protein [Microbulbifer discodermiae]|uniref:hypothetical protein n=1 Tax=Microbulbifer sp. 2201CG32-9 TaxID=3232309 RepID=UPI00345BE72B
MTVPTAVMTKLDAVNALLGSIGQSPVNTITGPLPSDAARAVLNVDTCLRDVLSKGWSFNTDTDYLLNPDVNGEILIPDNALWVDPVSQADDFVMRWEQNVPKLYDRRNRTFEIGRVAECNIIWGFNFEEIPQAARSYITARAGRIFQTNIVGSRLLYEYTQEVEREQYAAFKRMEKRSKRYNLIGDDPTAQRHYNPTRF